MEAIANFLKSVVEGVLGVLDYLNPFSENFILKGVLDFLGNILSYINPFSENFWAYKLIELLGDFFKLLFVPSDNNFEELSNKINEKFGFIGQIKDLAYSLLGFNNYGDKPPTFEITYMNNTVSIVDFSAFLEYRVWLHGIILAISWFMFARSLYTRLPGIIGGFGGLK